jgi:hypothetical protein
VREERLRTTAGLRETFRLTSWRGHSGRRYVAGVHPLTEAEAVDVRDAVLLAVRRDPDGTATIVDSAATSAQRQAPARRSWIARMRERGATEMHVHRLADGDTEQRAMLRDLRDLAG